LLLLFFLLRCSVAKKATALPSSCFFLLRFVAALLQGSVEDDGSCRRLLLRAVELRYNVAPPSFSCCGTAQLHLLLPAVELHSYNSTFFLLRSCVVAQLHNRKKKGELQLRSSTKKASATAVAFFFFCFALFVLPL